ncbi:MAG TPA: aminotransferase class V-fold PLP-dependent enzyme [Mycobacteriales bacterium]|nr:aminotransferase class V-fold PLP-dependent enzyme [Mycobacteriales bacterium]
MTSTASRPTVADVRAQVPAARGYLDTATCGLPVPATLDALGTHLRTWQDGSGSLEAFHAPVERSRALFAELAGVPGTQVAVGSQVSAAAGAVAASLPPGARVVLAEQDFTSLLWPFLQRTDLRCTLVPLDQVPAATAAADWVAVSSVQSCSGDLLDLDALRRAADESGARVLLDVTQSAGWLPLDASRWDVVVAGAYKWLLCPRGAAFTVVRPEVLDELVPPAPGWFAGEGGSTSYYGGPVRLARDARRLDVSPAWPCWAGAAPALQLLADLGVEAVHAHDVGLAEAFRARVGLPPSDSAVVSLDADVEALRAAGVRCSGRAGRARLAFHLYNDEDDVDLAARALGC